MSFVLQIFSLIFIIIKLTRCSLVLDHKSQKTIYVSSYCPKMKYCEEGTHVMCMYYDSHQKVGPRCENYVKITMKPHMIKKILEQVNQIRSKVAMGQETGKNNKLLPRAYGMIRLEWDSELAMFAEVLANQCLGGKQDVCRATSKFPNPSQGISIVRFKYPDWLYLSKNTTVRGLNDEKLLFVIEKFLSASLLLKKTVTDEIINKCPEWNKLPDLTTRYYLNLIRGAATHIGCGMSAYTKFSVDNNVQNIHNNVEVVCNISDSPQPSQPIYMTDPPIPGAGFTKQCGCPNGYKESSGCLCVKNTKSKVMQSTITQPKKQIQIQRNIIKKPANLPIQLKQQTQIQLKPQVKKNSELLGGKTTPLLTGECNKNIVLLPLFSIDNAPRELNYGEKTIHGMSALRTENRSSVKPGPLSLENTDYSKESYKEIISSLYDSTPEENNLNKRFQFVKNTKLRSETFSKDQVTHILKDKSFMSLLDVLEQLVQRIDLDDSENQIFELKMRQIYQAARNKYNEKHLSKQDKMSKPDNNENVIRNSKYTSIHESNEHIDNVNVEHEADRLPNDDKIEIVDNVETEALRRNNNYDYLDSNIDVDAKEYSNIISKRFPDNADNLDHNDNINFNNRNLENEHFDQYGENYEPEYSNIPEPRNQEMLDIYSNLNIKHDRISSSEGLAYDNVHKYDDKNLKHDNSYFKTEPFRRQNSERSVPNRSYGKTREIVSLNKDKQSSGLRFLSDLNNRRKPPTSQDLRRLEENKMEHPRTMRRMQTNQDHVQIGSRMQHRATF